MYSIVKPKFVFLTKNLANPTLKQNHENNNLVYGILLVLVALSATHLSKIKGTLKQTITSD
jgi:hypothetical protein